MTTDGGGKENPQGKEPTPKRPRRDIKAEMRQIRDSVVDASKAERESLTGNKLQTPQESQEVLFREAAKRLATEEEEIVALTEEFKASSPKPSLPDGFSLHTEHTEHTENWTGISSYIEHIGDPGLEDITDPKYRSERVGFWHRPPISQYHGINTSNELSVPIVLSTELQTQEGLTDPGKLPTSKPGILGLSFFKRRRVSQRMSPSRAPTATAHYFLIYRAITLKLLLVLAT